MAYPWTTATLSYFIERQPTTDPATLKGQAQAVPLVNGEADLIGFTVKSDATVVVAPTPQHPNGGVQRTLELSLTPQFNQNLTPDADPAAPFQQLYQIALEKALVSQVESLPPLVV
jgi:hypothetical protein